ncbi:hypothetical protein HN51_022412 [Arachis hypogaea]|uniref:Uncharacterized protein n=1 Tax=Arachis hypogaea TaxID=3818 RepID=A0A445ECE1_ARAHY|nr:uncharacterized protein At4g13200, chloroplastic [Arachis hypogaea]QHO53633.1 uncharacterized protein DS421_2g49640 [Arachis hypogaea]RYR73172.1 hypothetical protein Ahy_A02g007510 [Arachis hypogaea]
MNTLLSPSASATTRASFPPFSSNLDVLSCCSKLRGIGFHCKRDSVITALRCNSSIWPGGPASGDGDSSSSSRSILDAFFLGKAVAEAVNERVESAVGEFLSTVGRLQAEQQKQVQEFQEEVLERAKKAKEKAAREAQGLVPNYTAETDVADSATSRTSDSSTDSVVAVKSIDESETYTGAAKGEDPPIDSSKTGDQ